MGTNNVLKQYTRPERNYNPLTKKVLSAQAVLNCSDTLSNDLYRMIVRSHLSSSWDLLGSASETVINFFNHGSAIDSEVKFWAHDPKILDFVAFMLNCSLWSDIYVIKSDNFYDYWFIVYDDKYETYVSLMDAYNDYIIMNESENIDIMVFSEGQLDTDNMPDVEMHIRKARYDCTCLKQSDVDNALRCLNVVENISSKNTSNT